MLLMLIEVHRNRRILQISGPSVTGGAEYGGNFCRFSSLSAARELLNKSDNERSGVLSTAMSFLGLYRDPIVAKMTSRCHWRIAELVNRQRPARS
jgi:predicted aminopeptidase